jgi:hypothetical protein
MDSGFDTIFIIIHFDNQEAFLKNTSHVELNLPFAIGVAL